MLPLFLFIFTFTEHTYNILFFIYNTRRVPLLISSLLPIDRGPPLLWGAEPRFELGPSIQQADALLSEPRRTLLSHAAPGGGGGRTLELEKINQKQRSNDEN